jgi:hypothetical protein
LPSRWSTCWAHGSISCAPRREASGCRWRAAFSVAYVFVHILPDLAAHQRRVEEGGFLESIESHVWLLTMVGLIAFYGLERLARVGKGETGVFGIHLGSFALYNFLIGYSFSTVRKAAGLRSTPPLWASTSWSTTRGCASITATPITASAGSSPPRRSPAGGWACSTLCRRWRSPPCSPSSPAESSQRAQGELPEDRESRFPAFALGAAGYAALLLAAG